MPIDSETSGNSHPLKARLTKPGLALFDALLITVLLLLSDDAYFYLKYGDYMWHAWTWWLMPSRYGYYTLFITLLYWPIVYVLRRKGFRTISIITICAVLYYIVDLIIPDLAHN